MKLIKPTLEYQKSFCEMVADFKKHNEIEYPKYFTENESYEQYVSNLIKMEDEICNEYPTESFWLINDNDEIVGTIRYRKSLNEYTVIDGGHIGFDIRPSYRRNGYGNIILNKMLEILYERNVDKVLVTCELDNVGSKRIIEKNSGFFENEQISKRTNKMVRRYWIKTNKSN
jgi:predicted acetyltransferase